MTDLQMLIKAAVTRRQLVSIIDKVSRRATRLFKHVQASVTGDPHTYPVGSAKWLAATEKWFGGYRNDAARRIISPRDPRTPAQLAIGGQTGGDRMIHHGYGEHYARYLAPFLANPPAVVVEFGILRGTGLALWSKLFPDADLIGFDIDLSHTLENMEYLEERGAFASRKPELYTFDQFLDGHEQVGEALNDRKIGICIDDGYHADETILNTGNAIKRYTDENFVFFIEDNATVAPLVAAGFPEWAVESYGEMTVAKTRTR